MLPLRKILCPTDFSQPSYQALRAAGELAYHFDSELHILHVMTPVPIIPVGPEPSAFNVSSYEQESEATSKRSLEEVLNQIESKELKTHLIALRGNPADEIVRAAEEQDVDLIVIATRGRTGLDRLIFGSVAEKVVRLAPCPVLTVPSQHSKDEGQKVHPEKGQTGFPQREAETSEGIREKIEGQLKEWGDRIDELKAKAEKSKAEVKNRYEKQVELLRCKQEALQKKLLEMKESGEEAWEGLRASVEKSLDELKDTWDQTISRFKEVGEVAADTASKKKKAYVDKVEGQLREWGPQIDILKARAEKSKVEAQMAYFKQIEELKRKFESAKQKLYEIKNSGGEAWDEVKVGLDKTIEELKQTFNRARSKFKER